MAVSPGPDLDLTQNDSNDSTVSSSEEKVDKYEAQYGRIANCLVRSNRQFVLDELSDITERTAQWLMSVEVYIDAGYNVLRTGNTGDLIKFQDFRSRGIRKDLDGVREQWELMFSMLELYKFEETLLSNGGKRSSWSSCCTVRGCFGV